MKDTLASETSVFVYCLGEIYCSYTTIVAHLYISKIVPIYSLILPDRMQNKEFPYTYVHVTIKSHQSIIECQSGGNVKRVHVVTVKQKVIKDKCLRPSEKKVCLW